jgi:excisionase family DNA binding protein
MSARPFRQAGRQRVTAPEAARFLGVGRKNLYQLIEFGEIQASRTNGAVLVNSNSLAAFRCSGKLT